MNEKIIELNRIESEWYKEFKTFIFGYSSMYEYIEDYIYEVIKDIQKLSLEYGKSENNPYIKYIKLLKNIDLKGIRCFVCGECGKLLTEGFCIEDGEDYYCSNECMDKAINKEEYDNLVNNNKKYTGWVNWEG